MKGVHSNYDRYFNSKTYNTLRHLVSNACSGENNAMYGKTHSEVARAKISATHKGREITKEHRAKISNAMSGENHPLFGTTRSEDTKKKISAAMAGKKTRLGAVLTDETKEKIRKSLTGRKREPVSEETKAKLRAARAKQKPNPVMVCPYCKLESRNKGNMTRYHFDNCKMK